MRRQSLILELKAETITRVKSFLETQSLSECMSLHSIESLALEVGRVLVQAVFEAWSKLVEDVSEQWGRQCPECGRSRKCQRRRGNRMKIDLLCGTLEVVKPYLACGTPGCKAPGLNVARLLTGLRSGDASPTLKLEAARQAAGKSYGKARRALVDHPFGGEVERMKLRRLALEVEEDAKEFAESRRQDAYEELQREGHREGVALLVLEGDGGKVRVGKLRPLEPDEPGYGTTTPARGDAKRRRETTYREVITLDVRQLGEVEPTALDVLVPVTAPEGERDRRMLTLTGRKGLGDGTEVYGLGDMGSGLASAFGEAFFGYKAFWGADKKHTWDYIYGAASVLEGLDTELWTEQMRQAVLDRDEERRDELLEQARNHRVSSLPDPYERCPVHALSTYLYNNWKHMRFREMEERGLPTVSARAEAQVRDRTKDRFSVAGAWNVENIEGKAILRSLIDEGSYGSFVAWYWKRQQDAFCWNMKIRLDQAVQEKRLTAEAAALLLNPSTTVADVLRFPARQRENTQHQALVMS